MISWKSLSKYACCIRYWFVTFWHFHIFTMTQINPCYIYSWKKVICHPKWSKTSTVKDACLFKLKKKKKHFTVHHFQHTYVRKLTIVSGFLFFFWVFEWHSCQAGTLTCDQLVVGEKPKKPKKPRPNLEKCFGCLELRNNLSRMMPIYQFISTTREK